MHLEDAIDEVHDPVVLDSRPRVEAALVQPVECEARLRDLDHQGWTGRVRVVVIAGAAGNDDEIGLWLGVVIERHGRLGSDDPSIRNSRAHCIVEA